MYTLIGSPKSRGFRVMWMLEEAGQDYEVVAAAAGSEEARNYNPSGKIPALVVDDKVIIDSMAICQFIADRHKRVHLRGRHHRARPAGQLAAFRVSTSWTRPAGGPPSTRFVLPEEYRSADATQGLRVRLLARPGLAGRAPWRQRLCHGRQVHRARPADRALLSAGPSACTSGTVPEGPLTAYMNRVRATARLPEGLGGARGVLSRTGFIAKTDD
jgi:glutathione S-transferase